MDPTPHKPDGASPVSTESAAPVPSAPPPASAPEGASGQGTRQARFRTFAALRHKGFRYLWLGNLFSAGAWDIQRVSMQWLVYNLTGSAFVLAAMHGWRAAGMGLTAPLAGAVADRWDRRRLILGTQFFLAALSIVFLILVAFDRLTIFLAFVLSILVSIGTSFNNTARSAIVPSLVPKQDLVNAAALSSASANITRTIGPALGGVLIQTVGMVANFAVQSFYYVATFFSVLPIKLPPAQQTRKRPPFWSSTVGGLKYAWQDKTVGAILLMGLFPTFCALPIQTLAPIYAKEVFHRGAEGYGILLMSQGIGSLIGAFFLASVGDMKRKSVLQFGTLFLSMGMVVAYSVNTSLLLAIPILAIQSGGQMIYGSLNQALLQMRVPNEVLGRVMGLNSLNATMIPLGGLVSGLIAERSGAPFALTVMGTMGVVFAATAFFLLPTLRKV